MAVVRIEADIQGVGGAPGYTRLHFEVDDPTEGSTSMDFAVNDFHAFWQALDNGMYVGVTVLPRPEALIIDPATGQPTGVVPIDPVTITGASSDNPLPWATQALMRFRTGVYVGGREARGRCFVPGFTEATNDNGNVNNAGQTILAAAADALVGEVGAAQPVVLSKGAAVPIASAAGWNRFAVLRSRRD